MRLQTILAVLSGLALPGVASAADLFRDDVRTVLRSETLSVEVLAGYVGGTSTEYVYDSRTGRKLSQLNWDVASAAAVGGRVAFRPLDWLTVRARGWGTVAADSKMRDYDWLGTGYYGFNSYTDISVHPDTVTPQLWQGDASVAVSLWQDGELSLSAIGGYRFYQAKFDARGGSFLYSVNGFRDSFGLFPSGQSGVIYKQSWNTPYLGVGVAYSAGDWMMSGELIGSPFVFSNTEDNHPLRPLNIKGKAEMSSMIGVNTALEYRLTDTLSGVGRFEYQHYSEAKGRARYADPSTGEIFYNPKPFSAAAAETYLLSVGIKARL